jgi:D-beta-D-heptose 7-phosphate kinase/D-beta-D-heptose 1-phosphate adenosyltransferase
MSIKKIKVAVSGYFNPLHVGHLEMIEKAKSLGNYLIVIVNNDKQVRIKGSYPFMDEKDRVKIIKSLNDVDEVFLSIDSDATVCKSLAVIKPDIFANGGDRKNINNIPERTICKNLNIKMIDGLGKKIRASSEIITKAKKYKQL